MEKEIKIITFILENGPGYESEGVFSRSEAEWEIGKLLSNGWTFLGAGGGSGAEDLPNIGIGFVILARVIARMADDPLMRDQIQD